MDWNQFASGLLKAELKKRHMKYADLIKKLNGAGIDESINALNQKLSRGTFSATFLLQCLYALGVKQLNVQEYFETISSDE